MKLFLLIFSALVITCFAAFFQRTTGPTHPKKVQFEIQGQSIPVTLIRSGQTGTSTKISLPLLPQGVTAKLFYRQFPGQFSYQESQFIAVDSQTLQAEIPSAPPAGKYEYYLATSSLNQINFIPQTQHVVIRYKGEVPHIVLIVHIIFIFLAMFFSNLTAFSVLLKKGNYKTLAWITLLFLAIGGMTLGPIVQKYAFGEFWTGVPFGFDLTDNKTLLAFIAWLIACFGPTHYSKKLALLAAFLVLLIFSIPHSMFGSELNYQTGKVEQG